MIEFSNPYGAMPVGWKYANPPPNAPTPESAAKAALPGAYAQQLITTRIAPRT
jgi:hypothetical protein